MKKFISVFLCVLMIMPLCVTAFAEQKTLIKPLDFYSLKTTDVSEYGHVSVAWENDKTHKVLEAEEQNPTLNVANIPMNANGSGEPLPASYDSRTQGCVSSVKSQGNSSNCWAFTAVGALENDAMKHGYVSSPDFSEAHLAWFAQNSYDDVQKDGSTNSNPYTTAGNWMYSTMALSRWEGAANEEDYPFYPYDLASMGNYPETARYDRNGGVVLTDAERLTTMNEVKQWIIDHGSVEASFYYDQYYNGYYDNMISYICNISDKTNHQIIIVGWDDNYLRGNFFMECPPQNNGAWLCKNSWGNTWSDAGYFWISYEDASITDFIGYKSAPVSEYDNNYNYNGAISGLVSNTSKTAAANVFKAKKREDLKAVTTFILNQSEVTASIKVYRNLPANYVLPEQGTLASSKTVFLAHEGYHTIELDTPIRLAENEYFSVVIEYSHASGTVLVPLEFNTSNFHSEPKQSYLYLADYYNGWADSNVDYGYNNAYIGALTSNTHEYTSTITEPSCTEDGSTTYTCTICGDSYSVPIPATGHEFGEWTVTQELTCLQDGITERVCSKCGETETITEHTTGHLYGEWQLTVSPTCTESGVKTATCSKCGNMIEKNVSAMGHAFKNTWTVDVEPTCSETGVRSRHCARCEAVTATTAIPATGNHKYGEWIIDEEATYYSNGSKHMECSVCGNIIYGTVPQRTEKVVTLDVFLGMLKNAFENAFVRMINHLFSKK